MKKSVCVWSRLSDSCLDFIHVLFFLSQTFNVQFLFLAVKTFRFVFTFFAFKILDSLFNNYVYCLSLFAHGSHSNIRIFSGTRNISLVVLVRDKMLNIQIHIEVDKRRLCLIVNVDIIKTYTYQQRIV